MKKLNEKIITQAVSRLCIEANTHLRSDAESILRKSINSEASQRAKNILKQLLENAKIAREENLAICQDTGMPVVFVEIGRDIDMSGIDMKTAINKGVEDGYRRGYLRNSITKDPLTRKGPFGSSPCVIHFDFVSYKGLKLTVLPKGFGCENKTKLAMFNPTASIDEIKEFIISVVKDAGPDACPPYVIGIGIGGTAEYAAFLAKKALLKKVIMPQRHKVTGYIAKLEKELFQKINELNIGPMGLGGSTTVLGVNILTYPTHIAGLPVSVNVSCHALRSASVIL